jgi:hypothetical protein
MDGQRLLGWPTWVGIVVEDLPRQRQFWAELLGVPEDHSGPDSWTSKWVAVAVSS